jgi:hypothetical protein
MNNQPPWQLRDSERMIAGNAELLAQTHFLIGITRVRNEELILGDTLDFIGRHVDAIIAYDDASTDRTLELLHSHPKVAMILANRTWKPMSGRAERPNTGIGSSSYNVPGSKCVSSGCSALMPMNALLATCAAL